MTTKGERLAQMVGSGTPPPPEPNAEVQAALDEAAKARVKDLRLSQVEVLTEENRTRAAHLRAERQGAGAAPGQGPGALGPMQPGAQLTPNPLNEIGDILVKMVKATAENNTALIGQLTDVLSARVKAIKEGETAPPVQVGLPPEALKPKSAKEFLEELVATKNLMAELWPQPTPQEGRLLQGMDTNIELARLRFEHELAVKRIDLEIARVQTERDLSLQRFQEGSRRGEEALTVLAKIGDALADAVEGRAPGETGGPPAQSTSNPGPSTPTSVGRMLCISCQQQFIVPLDAEAWKCPTCGHPYELRGKRAEIESPAPGPQPSQARPHGSGGSLLR